MVLDEDTTLAVPSLSPLPANATCAGTADDGDGGWVAGDFCDCDCRVVEVVVLTEPVLP